MASARKNSSSKGRSTSGRRDSEGVRTTKRAGATVRPEESVTGRFAVCVRNDDYPASLEPRKLYPVLEDDFGNEHGMIRVVDESGEDYLFPSEYFVRVSLPQAVERRLRKIA